jgi:hypothetical protein
LLLNHALATLEISEIYSEGIMKQRTAVFATLIIICIATIVTTGCMTTAISKTELYREYFDSPVQVEKPSIAYELDQGTHVFHLTGTPYEMGYQYGEKATVLGIHDIYAEIFENATLMLLDDVPDEYRSFVTVGTVKSLLLDAWDRLSSYTPEYVHRMLEGFSKGADIPIDDVYAMHALPDFTETSCSAIWATGSATQGDETVQIRVLDYIMGLGIQKYPAVVFMDFEPGHRVANIGWLGLLGVISGMNDVGLAVSEMGYGNPDGENFHGIPMPFLLLDILRWSDNPFEASGIIKSNQRTNSYAYVIGSGTNGGLAFVTNAYEVESFGPGEQDAPVRQLPDMLHAGHYQDRMDALVSENHGGISIDWLMKEFIPKIAMDSNLQSVIYDLDDLRFFVANAPDTITRAADRPYSEFSF